MVRFDSRDFDEDIYPSYSNIIRGTGNLSSYSNIRDKIEELKIYIKRVNEELDKLEQLSDISYADFMTIVYDTLGKIERLSEEMDNIIGEIVNKMSYERENSRFRWYLNRIQIEVIEDILMNNASTIRLHMKQGLDIAGLSAELYPFIRKAKRELREVERSINLILRSI